MLTRKLMLEGFPCNFHAPSGGENSTGQGKPVNWKYVSTTVGVSQKDGLLKVDGVLEVKAGGWT